MTNENPFNKKTYSEKISDFISSLGTNQSKRFNRNGKEMKSTRALFSKISNDINIKITTKIDDYDNLWVKRIG